MSSSALARTVLGLLGLALSQAATAQVLTPEEAIGEALAHSPSLAGMLVSSRSAAELVSGEEHRLVPTFGVDTVASTATQPEITATPGSSQEQRYSTLTGTLSLSQELVWGTQLGVQAEGANQWGVSGVASGLPTPPGTSTELLVSVTQPLLRGAGRTVVESPLRQARLLRNQANAAAEQTASALVRDTLLAYWELYYATEQVRIEEKSREVTRAQRDDAAARASTGTLAPADVLSFETKLASAEETVTSARQTLEQRQRELARLLGRRSGPLPEVSSQPPPLPPEVVDPLDAEHGPGVTEAKAVVEVSRDQELVAGEALRPQLNLIATAQTLGFSNQLSGALKQTAVVAEPGASLEVSLQLPVDRSRERSEITRAALARRVAELQVETTRQQAESDLRTLLAKDRASRQLRALAQTTLEVAERQLAAEKERFETGSGTSLQVRTAEEDVRDARLRELRSRVDIVQNWATIEDLAGLLLGDHRGRVEPG